MKKVLAIAAIAVFAISLQSCKKEYTCNCTSLDGNLTASTETVKSKDETNAAADCALKGGFTKVCVLAQ